MTTATQQTWLLQVVAPGAWLTANVERHRFQRSTLVRQWRDATWYGCVLAKLPRGITTPVSIHLDVIHATARAPVRDRLNLAPTVKAIVDALTPPRQFTRGGRTYTTVGWGFLTDDSDRQVLDTTWHLRMAEPGELRPGLVGRVDLAISVNGGGDE
jgi:hypothetical protein